MSDINYGPFPRLLNEEEIYLLHLNHCIFPYPERIILLARRPDEPDWMMIKVPGGKTQWSSHPMTVKLVNHTKKGIGDSCKTIFYGVQGKTVDIASAIGLFMNWHANPVEDVIKILMKMKK